MKIEVDGNTDVSAIPFCTECKWYYRSWHDLVTMQGHKFGKCERPVDNVVYIDVDLVSGKVNTPKPDTRWARVEREYDQQCGPSGRYFSPKDKRGLFKLLKRKDF